MSNPRRSASLPRLNQRQLGSAGSSPGFGNSHNRSSTPTSPASRRSGSNVTDGLLGTSNGEGSIGLQQSLLETHEVTSSGLAQVLLALYETHATKAQDRLDIDRFIKAQTVLQRVLGDKVAREDLTSTFLELSRGTHGEQPCEVFCDWQLRALLAKGMNFKEVKGQRQIIRLITQAIAEILQEHVDDPGTVNMHARSQVRKAEHHARRKKLSETVGWQLHTEARQEVAAMCSELERGKREKILQELVKDEMKYQRRRELAFNKVHSDSIVFKRFTQTVG